MSDEQPQQDGNAPAGEAPASEHLNLKVKSQDGNEVYFKVRLRAHRSCGSCRLECASIASRSLFGSRPSCALVRMSACVLLSHALSCLFPCLRALVR